jgi:hypothetical protein
MLSISEHPLDQTRSQNVFHASFPPHNHDNYLFTSFTNASQPRQYFTETPRNTASILGMGGVKERVERRGTEAKSDDETRLRAGRMHAKPSGWRCHIRDQEHGTWCHSIDRPTLVLLPVTFTMKPFVCRICVQRASPGGYCSYKNVAFRKRTDLDRVRG